ncbi:EamA family transporter [Candidatus Woesearchaeota archaeon]|nr:EamA family transporter [Candidatus Woesearchaeota archaeon]
MMQTWLVYAILAFLLWGFWGFFPKLTTAYIKPPSAMVYETAGALIVAVVVLLFLIKGRPELHSKGILFAVVTGMAGITGAFFFLSSLSVGGKTSVVVTLTALYPLITILLSVLFLHETVTITQGMGILLALIAILLISL